MLANDLYYQLKQEGFKVFFARITLEDKLGSAYEPYIFAALNSAKVMVVLGTKPEHFNAVWVKNEWSRYLALVKKSGGKKVLIPAYRDMDPYDLPEEFSHLQAQDMSKLGFMQDLIRGIKKIAKVDEPKATVKEMVVVGTSNANVAPLLERAFLFLEDGKWQDANNYCEKVLDIDPKNAEAYLGKLMADLQVRTRKQLADCAEPFDDRGNYGKVLRFGDEKLEAEMRGYISHINERNENARLTGIYKGAVSAMNTANTESAYKAAADSFRLISGFQDSDELAEQCLDKAEVCRKNAIYASARTEQIKNSIAGCESAIRLYESISGWKDADEQIYACRKKIEETKAKEEADRLERERQAEQKRIAAEKAAKKRKKIAAIVTPIVVACIAFVIVLTTVIIPNGKYNAAVKLYNEGEYEKAVAAFEAMNGYKDSATQITKCETAIKDAKYNSAMSMIDEGKYVEAYEALIDLNYKDSAAKAKEIYGQYEVEKLKTAKVGDYVVFGSYEQDNNTSNGKENIEWLVLAKEGNKALVISKNALDCQEYNTSDTSVTWETCSLRKWLNGTFIRAAFNSDEQNMIPNTTVTADKNPSYSTSPGNNTTDKVFLLSITEVNQYLSSVFARWRGATEYAKAQGAYTNINSGRCEWWLRSPGRNSLYAACVNIDGYVSYAGHDVNDSDCAVRPALWINLGS
ncbi:MAG: toll/interleukin-1 receptor domain-containing protein [Clostridia bacterium]|nr:toll/interleukin-1 receptor domain-containing protein [Clostridia bacterium]